jgi:hypothetical protein
LQAAQRADALLQRSPESNSGIRVQGQLSISRSYLAKKLPEQAEEHARLGIKLWESAPDRSLAQLFVGYELLVHALAAQDKHWQVVEVVEGVAKAPKDDLVDHDVELVPILLDGYNSAVALKDYNSAIRFMFRQQNLWVNSSVSGRRPSV